MMEPSNLDHHHHEELHGGSSSFPPPSLHLVGGSHDQWNPNLRVNGGGDFISSSRDFKINNETPLPIIQDLGFHWGGNAETFMNHSSHQSTSEDLYHLPSTSYIKHEHQKPHDMNVDLLGLHPQVDGSYLASLASFVGNMSPSIPPSYSMPLAGNIDLQPLDLLASARFGRSFCEPSLNSTMALLREESSPFGFSHLQGPCNSYHKVSTLVGGVTESKRGNNVLEQRASQAASKKPRFEARSSFSPFKVRKEKLGDRIAALQQLVAPFGKTDTASVLMEVIGYIKFLHDQVEKLSVPYMRSSNNVHLRITQGASGKDKDEQGPNLRSRGLCLVPLSYTSFVTKRMEEFGLHQTNYEPM